MGDNVVSDLKKRKLIVSMNKTYFVVYRSSNFSTSVVKQEAELTAELMANGDYERKDFKPYNFNALGTPISGGHLHPLLKVF